MKFVWQTNKLCIAWLHSLTSYVNPDLISRRLLLCCTQLIFATSVAQFHLAFCDSLLKGKISENLNINQQVSLVLNKISFSKTSDHEMSFKCSFLCFLLWSHFLCFILSCFIIIISTRVLQEENRGTESLQQQNKKKEKGRMVQFAC